MGALAYIAVSVVLAVGGVLLDSQPVTRPGPDRGMMFQSYTLFPWLAVRDNILFGARATAEIADALIAKVGLRGFANHYPKMLSGRMQQRTALARACQRSQDPAARRALRCAG